MTGAISEELRIVFLRGVPGSGKTTWAREQCAAAGWLKRISKDDLRQMFDAGEYSPNQEEFILKAQNALIRAALESGLIPVIDDTNTRQRDLQEIRNVAYLRRPGRSDVAVPIEIRVFHTPLAECIRRDALREKPIGARRIVEMHWRLFSQELTEADYAIAQRVMEASIEE